MQTGESDSARLPTHTTLPVIFGVALATGFSGAVVPGSLLAVVVRESVRFGWAAGPVMMIGHGLLELVAIVLLLVGAMRFARAPIVRGLLGLMGAIVLVYLGCQTLIIPGEVGEQALQVAQGTLQGTGGWLRLIWLGALMSMANPYWWLWWASIGAAHSGWAAQRGRLGGTVYFTGHILSDVSWYSAVSTALGAGRSLLSAGTLRAVYLTCSVFLIGLGLLFGISGFRTLRARPEPAAGGVGR